MILARNSVTLSWVRDIASTWRYYKLQSSTASKPSKPTAYPPSGWQTSEPSYTSGSTNSLYTVECTVYVDGTFDYSEVSLSSSYEAAKEAYNKANAAYSTANTAKSTADTAKSTADAAKTAAANAQTAANSKNAVFYQTSAPTGTHKVNDIWFDTGHGNAMYAWDGTKWAQHQFGTVSIADGTVTADKLYALDVIAQQALFYDLVANSLTIGGHSTFRGNMDGVSANIGGVQIGCLDSACTRSLNITTSTDSSSYDEAWNLPRRAGTPSYSLMYVGVALENSNSSAYSEPPTFSLTVNNVHLFTERVPCNQGEVRFPIHSTSTSNSAFDGEYSLSPSRAGTKLTLTFYFGDRAQISTDGSISAGGFVEGGHALSYLYAAKSHNHDSSYAAKNHDHSLIKDSANGVNTIFAYSKAHVEYADYTWLAGWINNGSSYELRAVAKSDFAKASHTHAYLSTSGGTVNGDIGFGDAYDTADRAIYCKWKDGANHNLIGRSKNGLNAFVGWPGSSSYATVLDLRSRTVRVLNASGTTNLSDERLKKNWINLDKYDAFFDAVDPKAFQYIDGSSGRYHLGFSAQAVEQALADSGLSNQDFGGIVKQSVDSDSEDYHGYDEEYGLIYTEFIALTIDQVQKLKARVNELEHEVDEMQKLKAKLDAQDKVIETLLGRLEALERSNEE